MRVMSKMTSMVRYMGRNLSRAGRGGSALGVREEGKKVLTKRSLVIHSKTCLRLLRDKGCGRAR